MNQIGILTGGGDAPGLNAVIRAVVKTAILKYDCQVLGIKQGFEGLLADDGVIPLDIQSVQGIIHQGGTILGAANRGNPFQIKVMVDGKEVDKDLSNNVVKRIDELDLDALIVVGGDGSLRIAMDLFNLGVPVIGVPKTIDNDIGGTDFTFGFDTAVNTATEAIDRLHTTAESHHRVMVLELMGRNAGFITLFAGLAGGADVILIPEIPFNFELVCKKVKSRIESGSHFSIISVAEGAHPVGGQQVFRRAGDPNFVARLGGIGQVVSKFVESVCGAESRVTVLGHLQRGGSPSAFDRWLGTRFGAQAVRVAAKGVYGRMVALRGSEVIDVDIRDALKTPKILDVHGDAIRAARALNISFGD